VAIGRGSIAARAISSFAGIFVDFPGTDAHHPPQAVISMGDKSPKAKDKAKKQHTADKDQKHAAAVQKAKAAFPVAGKKGG
jgi:hypothetical protein